MGLHESPPRGRVAAFSFLYLAYVCCYGVRRNLAIVIPALTAIGVLDHAGVGIVTSVFETSIGVSKLLCGPFVDSVASPSRLLAASLALAAVSNYALLVTLQHTEDYSYRLLGACLCWGMNGALQALAWPALARVFMAWYPDPRGRGLWYGLLSTTQGVGSTVVALGLPGLVALHGWSSALVLPASCALPLALAIAVFLRDAPATATVSATKGPDAAAAVAAAAARPGLWATVSGLVRNKRFMCLTLGYIPITVIRVGVATWTPMILQSSRSLTLGSASVCLSAFELGGFCGGLLGGVVSDVVFRGQRGPAMCAFSLCIIPVVLAMSLESVGEGLALQGLYFLLGIASFAPHMFIGLAAREFTPKEIHSSAGCFAKAAGQLGGALAGYPLTLLASRYGWGCTTWVFAFMGVGAALAFVPLVVPAGPKGKEHDKKA